MQRFIALLRGINVGGKKLVSMAALRDCFADAGLHEPRTLLQSGNVVFESAQAQAGALAASLERRVAQQFKQEVKLLIRTAAEWRAAIEQNPFKDEAAADPAHLAVMFLSDHPASAMHASLKSAIVGRERIELIDRTLYIVYPDGIGTSRFTNALIERKLGTAGTARNWNTVLKIGAALNPIG